MRWLYDPHILCSRSEGCGSTHIDVGKEIAPILGSRDVVRGFLKRIDNITGKIVLDFNNVEFVSRSAAHVLLEYERCNPDRIIEFCNMNKSVKKMFDLVKSQLNGLVSKDKLKSRDIDVVELTV